MKILILAGGYGTRLYPLVKDTPKALLEVCGRTLIDHTLERFYGVPGVEEVCVVTNDKFVHLLKVWADGKKDMPFSVRVISDGTKAPEERLGAIGDILFVVEKEGVKTDWLVAGSDNLFDKDALDFVRFAQTKGPYVSVGAYDVGDIAAASKYGVMALAPDGKMISLEEKPKDPKSSLVSMCLYYFPKDSLSLLRRYVADTHSTDTTGGCIQWLYQKSPVYGFKFQGKWYDIGSLESYAEAQKSFIDEK